MDQMLVGEQNAKPEAAAMLGKHVVLRGLGGAAEMNCLIGTVASFDPARNRFRVAVEDRARPVDVRPTNLRLATEQDILPPEQSLRFCLDADVDVDVLHGALQRAV